MLCTKEYAFRKCWVKQIQTSFLTTELLRAFTTLMHIAHPQNLHSVYSISQIYWIMHPTGNKTLCMAFLSSHAFQSTCVSTTNALRSSKAESIKNSNGTWRIWRGQGEFTFIAKLDPPQGNLCRFTVYFLLSLRLGLCKFTNPGPPLHWGMCLKTDVYFTDFF